jgi:hypothetical protein
MAMTTLAALITAVPDSVLLFAVSRMGPPTFVKKRVSLTPYYVFLFLEESKRKYNTKRLLIREKNKLVASDRRRFDYLGP